MNAHATPTPSPEKLAIWTLEVARHTDKLTCFALVIGVVALVIAFVALFLALSDNRMNRIQISDLQRKPKLFVESLWVQGKAEKRTTDAGKTVFYYYSGGVSAQVKNEGDRTAAGFQIELWIPTRYFNPDNSPAQNAEETIRGVKCYRFWQVSDSLAHPRGPGVTIGFNAGFWLITHSPKISCFWRLNDEYAQYPRSDYGESSFVLLI